MANLTMKQVLETLPTFVEMYGDALDWEAIEKYDKLMFKESWIREHRDDFSKDKLKFLFRYQDNLTKDFEREFENDF